MNRHRFAGLSAAVLIVLILFSCRERVKVGSRVSYKSPDLLEFLKTESDLTVLPLLTGFPDSLQGISSAERLESDIKVNFRDLKIKKYSVLYNRLNGESEAGALLSLMSDFLETGEIQGGPDSSLASYFESRYVLFSREIKRESVKNFDGVTNERYVVECMIYDLKYRKKYGRHWSPLIPHP
ncbi:MAG: hypothetical protein ACLFQK_11040 [Fibrobacterota bacterium]